MTEEFSLESQEDCNEHICADLARLLGYRLNVCESASDEIFVWTLRDENNQLTEHTLEFYPVSNHVQVVNADGNILSKHKLSITLTS
jgi:hypothetical protein